MGRTGRHADVPPEPPDLGEAAGKVMAYCERVGEGLARLEAIMDAAEQGKPLPPGMDPHHLSLFNADWRQIGSGLHAHVEVMQAAAFRSSGDAVAVALARAEGRQEGAQAVRHSHRKPRGGRKPSDGQVIPFPAGKTVAAAATAAAVTAALTLGPGAVSDLAHWSPAAPASHHAAASLPSLGPASAVPFPPPPSPPGVYKPRHARPSADAASASPEPSSSVTFPAPPSPPSPAPSRVAFTGSLNLQTDHLAIAPFQVARLTFSAVGGSVSWTASAPAGVVLSVSGGVLGDGQPQVVKVSVPAGTPAGSGVIVVTDGEGRSFQVPVSWAAVPLV